MNSYVFTIVFCFFSLSTYATQICDSTRTPLAIYKQALNMIEKSKEYKKYKKKQHLKKEKYVVSSEIEDFQTWAFILQHNPGVHYDEISYYENDYTDDAMQQLSQAEEGRILIYFSSIDHDFFWVSIYPSRIKIKNPKAKDSPIFCRMLLFLFRCENSNAKFVSAKITQLN